MQLCSASDALALMLQVQGFLDVHADGVDEDSDVPDIMVDTADFLIT